MQNWSCPFTLLLPKLQEINHDPHPIRQACNICTSDGEIEILYVFILLILLATLLLLVLLAILHLLMFPKTLRLLRPQKFYISFDPLGDTMSRLTPLKTLHLLSLMAILLLP